MSCGKRPLVKKWDHPRKIRVIKPSIFENNETSVKQHWKNVIKELELSCKDEKFWESSTDQVRELVGPVIFKRLAKIFSLPMESKLYEPKSDSGSFIASEECYKFKKAEEVHFRPEFSLSDFQFEQSDADKAEEEEWSILTESIDENRLTKSRSMVQRSKSAMLSRIFSSKLGMISSAKLLSRSGMLKSSISRSSRAQTSMDDVATTDDDLEVQTGKTRKGRGSKRGILNPHFKMLYCNESETDMIKWNSKYKQKTFEVSASDEFSKKAEIMTKQIAKDFYDWWVGLGNVEFKSEIKRPEDIEDLFQVWFDEHASRGIVLDPKILPCVLKSIADYVGVPKASCPSVLKRQIAYDIHAETSPAHTRAFETCLPLKMKHIPPKNNTEKMWHSVVIPEDLRSMACVWDDVQHLTSTKAFQKWLQMRPHLPMPPCLKAMDEPGDKKQPFVVPSDYVVRDKNASSSTNDLNLPVSQFSLELKEVLSKLMNQ